MLDNGQNILCTHLLLNMNDYLMTLFFMPQLHITNLDSLMAIDIYGLNFVKYCRHRFKSHVEH
jgi:hypothetical protein